jgi:hypothetical protein
MDLINSFQSNAENNGLSKEYKARVGTTQDVYTMPRNQGAFDTRVDLDL